MKLTSYVLGDKVWLNSKYIKTKQNQKLEAKFFGLFWVLHPANKQAYKLKLLKKYKIHNVFYVSLLEQGTTRKERVKKVPKLKNGNDSKEYKIKVIWNSMVYARESEGHLPRLYYLVEWKGYPKEKNTWEPVLAIQYIRKLISLFHKNHPEKPIATSPPVDSTPPMTRPTVKPAKPIWMRKRGQPINNANKQAKKNWTFCSFSHVASPRPWLLNFIKKRWFSFSKSVYQVKRFFLPSAVYQIIFSLSIFPPQFLLG